MEIEFDPAKNESNRAKHGLDFSLAAAFEFDSAIEKVDDRYDYGETRFVALGYIEDSLHVLVYTQTETAIRVISLRKATAKERRKYDELEETRPHF